MDKDGDRAWAQETFVVIPARRGSKRVPRKNVRTLAGRALIEWTLLAVVRDLPNCRIVVSTDDPGVAELAGRFEGVLVVRRPKELATDSSTTEAALLHVLEHVSIGDQATVVLLQATSPCRPPGQIQTALEAFRASGADSLVGVMQAHPFLWSERADGFASPGYDLAERPRSQDDRYQPMLIETGSIYVSRAGCIRESGLRVSGNVLAHRMPIPEALDLDTIEDFLTAEACLKFEVDG